MTDNTSNHFDSARAFGKELAEAFLEKISDSKHQNEEAAAPPVDMYDMWGDNHPKLNYRQIAMYGLYEGIINDFGLFDQGCYADGAHYSEESPFADKGMVCGNCVFYDGEGQCEIVSGKIAANGICKLWIIPDEAIVESSPTEGQ